MSASPTISSVASTSTGKTRHQVTANAITSNASSISKSMTLPRPQFNARRISNTGRRHGRPTSLGKQTRRGVTCMMTSRCRDWTRALIGVWRNRALVIEIAGTSPAMTEWVGGYGLGVTGWGLRLGVTECGGGLLTHPPSPLASRHGCDAAAP